MPKMDFNRAPFLILWELTRACALSCKHCRAEAVLERDERELSTDECKAMMDHMREEYGPCLIVLTGGDPLIRPDLMELIAYGKNLGLRMTVTPAATPRLTKEVMQEMKDAGVARVAISLDGLDAETHDTFRGEDGSFQRTMDGLTWAKELGIESQVNTSIGTHNRHQLEEISDIVAWHGCKLWSVFLIVPTGRAERELISTAREHEETYQLLADINDTAPYDIKTTAGQPFYRVKAQRLLQQNPELNIDDLTPQRFGLRAPRGVNDGNGVIFVGRLGEVKPSGFFDADCGNVRETPLADIYRDHELFQELRRPDDLGGKCGKCEFRRICGGSRSRTFALTGKPLAADPTCAYVPPAARKKT